jgi:ABC-type nitrate/sulfonate/bicarbonate transport system substrate-binding protein
LLAAMGVLFFFWAGANPATAADRIIIGSPGPSLSILPIELAIRKGFFKQEGLEVLHVTMRTNIIINALVTGEIDYATPIGSVLRGATNGLPVKAVGILLGRPDYFLTVKPGIDSLKDLKGKRIAIGNYGSSSDVALRAVLEEEGVDPINGVQRLQMGGASSRFAALVAGAVDATITTIPYNLLAEKKGFKNLVWIGARIEMPLSGLGVRLQKIANAPGEIVKTLRGVSRAIDFAKNNQDATVDALMNWTKIDRDAALASYDLGKKSWPDYSITSDKPLQAVVDQAAKEMQISKIPSLEQVRDWTFAREVRRELESTRPQKERR